MGERNVSCLPTPQVWTIATTTALLTRSRRVTLTCKPAILKDRANDFFVDVKAVPGARRALAVARGGAVVCLAQSPKGLAIYKAVHLQVR